MKTSDVDKNLAVERAPWDAPIVYLDAKDKPFSIHGLCRIEKGKNFTRIPEDVAAATSDGVGFLNYHTAGGRIRFSTNSPWIALKVKMPYGEVMAHITQLGQSGFDFYYSEKGNYKYGGSLIPWQRDEKGYETSMQTDGKWHTYTLYMPLYDPVDEVYVGLHAEAEIEPPEDYTYKVPVLYYGSSITQGGCASRPGNSYQAMISRRVDADYINLGFSGNAKGEPVMREYLAGIESSVFVCDYDHNAPDPEHLEKTHRPLYEAYRAAHPDTPIVFVTRPNYNPDDPNDELRRRIVMKTYEDALKSGDTKVSFVDGSHLFDGPYADSCTVDGCHPNDLGFYRMAMKIGDDVEMWLKGRK